MQIEFNIQNQTLKRTDDLIVVSDSKSYLRAHFSFSDDWNDILKVAQFTRDGETYDVNIIDSICAVPWEVLDGEGTFVVNVFGGDLITVNECSVYVHKSGLREGQLPSEPTPGYFQDTIDRTKGYADEAGAAKDICIEKAEEVESDKSVVISNANAVSLNKDATDANKTLTEENKAIAVQKAAEATEQMLLAKYYSEQAQSIVSSIPMRYYRPTVESMETITAPIQGDLCYVTDYLLSKTQLYVYDTVDIDEDEINPEWVFLGNLEFANLDKNTLLGILQLSAVAISGSYLDLINKPNRYEGIIVLPDGNWDYSLGDWAKLTITVDTALNITNVYNGAFGVIEILGNHVVTLPVNSYGLPPEWNYITLAAGQHYVYSFRYDGNKFSWKRSVASDT